VLGGLVDQIVGLVGNLRTGRVHLQNKKKRKKTKEKKGKRSKK
jgi:hypothetical protein